MAKPKVVRNNINTTNIGKGWWEWLTEQGYGDDDIYTNQISVDKEVRKTGKTVEQVKAERVELKEQLEAEYDLYIDSEKAKAGSVFQIRNNTLDSIVSVYQRADRILTGLNVMVSVSETEVAPAYNDGKDIVFSGKLIKDLDENTIMSLQGLNYHELGHLLFTPRIGTVLGKWVVEKGLKTNQSSYDYIDSEGNTHTNTRSWTTEQLVEPARQMAFNILEDCRAEHYLTLKYPSIRPFMVTLLGDYILDNNLDKLGEQFILLAGRRYFSLELRKLSAQMFIAEHGKDKAQAIYEIISEYRTLVFPRQYDRAKDLITLLIALLPKDSEGKTKPVGQNPNGCIYREPMRNGRPATEKEQEALSGNAGNGKDGLGEVLDKLGEGLTAGDGSGGFEETGEINSETADFNSKDEEVIRELQEVINRAKADKSLQKKVRDTLKAIQKDRSSKSILEKTRAGNYTPELSEVTASRLFAQELELLRIESDPAWNREKPSGKLNVKRAMNADINRIDTLFDRWQEGNDDYDIEASILIDRSGSMWNEIGSACRSAWVIKRAIERINGKVSVSVFSDYARELFDRDTLASATDVRIVEAGGGTDPKESLDETLRIMDNTTAKTKLVFILTDGAWFRPAVADSKIEQLIKQGCYVSVVWLGSEEYAKTILSDPNEVIRYSHGANSFRTIQKPSELVKVAKDVVKAQMNRSKVRG
jgi:hypothetical protein